MIRTKTVNGRDTNVIVGSRHKKALGLPQGVGWSVPVPCELLESPSWRLRPERARKVIDAVMAEHARNGGKENGSLVVPYSDISAMTGLRRNYIRDGIMEAVALGLLAVTEQGRRSYGARLQPSRYRLTWLGTPDGMTPTNEWRAIKEDAEVERRIGNARDRVQQGRTYRRRPHIRSAA